MASLASASARPWALGTAQLGMDYGIANREGAPDLRRARAVVAAAFECGVRYFDTAQAYGESEGLLGRAFRELGVADRVRVVSKLDPSCPGTARDVARRVEASLKALGVPRLWAFLLHREERLGELRGGLGNALMALRERGLVERLGVSLYSPRMALAALKDDRMEVLQVPASPFDRRLVDAGFFARAADRGGGVFVRSIYLQGLLCMAPAELPPRLAAGRRPLAAYRAFCRRWRVDPRAFALAWVRRQAPAAIPVVGAETPEQVRSTRNLAMAAIPDEAVAAWSASAPEVDERLVDPSRWPVAAP